MLDQIKSAKDLTDDDRGPAVTAIKDFKFQFNASDGKPVTGEQAEAMDADEVGHEAVTGQPSRAEPEVIG